MKSVGLLLDDGMFDYDYTNNAVTSITHKNPNGTQIVQHSYTYDNTNNIVEYLNSIDGQTTYDYDFLGQLIGADYANQTDESYIYDSNGNRLTANGSNYTTSENNELTSDGDYTYTYDTEGNRISKTNTSGTERELYTWDYRNRLTSVTKQTYNNSTNEWTTVQIVEYAYDYNNIWIRKTVGDSKTIFIPENYQTAVQIDNGITTHHYLWTPNAQDKLIADTTTNGILWSLTDHLGTIRDILGTASTHLIYDAFGNLISGTNPLLFGYTGKAFDTDTNLQNNINRWYDSTVGRWLSTDPIGFNGNDANLYRYVHNRSMNFIDFSGLIKEIFIEPTPWLDGEAAMRVEYDENDCGYIMLTINGEQKWRDEFNGNLVVRNYKFDYGWLRKDSGYVEIEVGQKDGSAKIYRKNYETQYHDLLSYDNKFTYIPVENAGVSNIMLSLSGIYRQIWSHERTDFIFHWFPVAAEWRTPISITVNLFAGREAGDSRIAISYPSSNAFGDMNIVGPASSFREIPSISGTGPRGNVHNYTSAVSLTYLNNLEKWFKPLTRAEETGDKFRFAILPYVTTGHGLGLGIPRKFSFQLPGTTRKQ